MAFGALFQLCPFTVVSVLFFYAISALPSEDLVQIFFLYVAGFGHKTATNSKNLPNFYSAVENNSLRRLYELRVNGAENENFRATSVVFICLATHVAFNSKKKLDSQVRSLAARSEHVVTMELF